ncbi:MAG: threonine synthase, partial [Muribaculaceae bacterium]|nr:threonine synthase [Muribaculaceae bacterium]
MKYRSTAGKSPEVSLEEAVVKGLAPDRGLYMPLEFPRLSEDFIKRLPEMSLPEMASEIAVALFGEDVDKDKLKALTEETMNFPIPLVKVTDNKYSLELFHGPTLAFKDVGARFMARLLGYFNRNNKERLVNVLVATSGDTGSAVANGFLGVEGVRVFVLYP